MIIFWKTYNNYYLLLTLQIFESNVEQADLSHELLGGEDQLVVDEPAWLLLEQRAVGMDVDRLLVLHCLVAAFTQSCRVVEISSCHRLRDGQERWERGLQSADLLPCRLEINIIEKERYKNIQKQKINVCVG